MRKLTKIGLFCLLSGFLLALSAYLTVGADISQLSLGGAYQKNTYSIPASEVDSLEIYADYRNVEIVGINQNEISVVYYENKTSYFEFDLNNREFSVRSLHKTEFPYINFEFGWNVDKYTTVITVPQDLLGKIKVITQSSKTLVKDLEGQQKVEIFTTSGDILLDNNKIKALIIEMQSGKVTLAKTETDEQIHVQSESGNASLSNVQAKGMRLDIKSGDVDLHEVGTHDGAINIYTKSGNVNLKGLYSNKSIDIQSGSGDIKGLITGKPSDYNIRVQAQKSNLESTRDIDKQVTPLQLISTSGIVEVNFD